MIAPTPRRLPDASPDDPWQRAHTFPEFDERPPRRAVVGALVVVAIIFAAGVLTGAVVW
jgi:hypothetical protein